MGEESFAFIDSFPIAAVDTDEDFVGLPYIKPAICYSIRFRRVSRKCWGDHFNPKGFEFAQKLGDCTKRDVYTARNGELAHHTTPLGRYTACPAKLVIGTSAWNNVALWYR